jgi:hypothetical protein
MEYDEDATQYMDAIRLMHMLQNIEEPWGFGKEYKVYRLNTEYFLDIYISLYLFLNVSCVIALYIYTHTFIIHKKNVHMYIF